MSVTHPSPPFAKRLAMEISFDGTAYQGWQVQPDNPTVQAVVANRLERLYKAPITLHGSGRTDAGVHALGMLASFTPPPPPRVPDKQVTQALNRLLPNDIAVNWARPVADDFHARFSSRGKAYTYIIARRQKCNPFTDRWVWRQPLWLDLDALRAAADFLVGKHDFSSFAVSGGKINNAVRTIHRIDIDEFGQYLCLSFVGDGFLYKMIRSIVGSLAPVADGRQTPDFIAHAMAAKSRSEAGETAPPTGLFLMKVFLEENEWRNFKLDAPPFIAAFDAGRKQENRRCEIT